MCNPRVPADPRTGIFLLLPRGRRGSRGWGRYPARRPPATGGRPGSGIAPPAPRPPGRKAGRNPRRSPRQLLPSGGGHSRRPPPGVSWSGDAPEPLEHRNGGPRPAPGTLLTRSPKLPTPRCPGPGSPRGTGSSPRRPGPRAGSRRRPRALSGRVLPAPRPAARGARTPRLEGTAGPPVPQGHHQPGTGRTPPRSGAPVPGRRFRGPMRRRRGSGGPARSGPPRSSPGAGGSDGLASPASLPRG